TAWVGYSATDSPAAAFCTELKPANTRAAEKISRQMIVFTGSSAGALPQSPAPGFGKKYWNLSGFPSHSFQSGGGAFLTLILVQIFAYSAFNDSHFSSPGSVSSLMASTGHSGSQTPQSIHSSGLMTSIFLPS